MTDISEADLAAMKERAAKCAWPDCPGYPGVIPMHEIEAGPELHAPCLALASERAKRVEAENLAFDRLEQLIAAEATIVQASALLAERGGVDVGVARSVLDREQSHALSALARHDAEVWDEGWKRGVIESSTGYSKYESGDNPYRARAAEKRAKINNEKETD